MTKKLILDIDETTWKEVQKLKIEHGWKNNNETVVNIIKWAVRMKPDDVSHNAV